MDINLTPEQIRADLLKAVEIMRLYGTPEQREQFRDVRYTGHVGQGGLQGHSVGDVYPWIVYGQETTAGTMYGVMHASDGRDTGPQFDSLAAVEHSERFKSDDGAFGRYMAHAERVGKIVRIPDAAVKAGVACDQ